MKWYEDPVYIKMCEKAEELQKDWKPDVGDYLLRRYTVFGEPLDSTMWPNKKDKEELIILNYHSGLPEWWHSVTPDGESRLAQFPDTSSRVKATCIWLPRQDQLQEMVKWKDETDGQLLDRCHVWFLDWAHTKSSEPFNLSMEQLWLAFVMKEEYQKRWDSDKSEWVKE